MDVAARRMGKVGSRNGEKVLGILSVVGVTVSLILSLAIAPPDAVQGDVQRIMYIHVPAAWLAYLSFFVVFIASIAYLRTNRIRWDRVAAASAEIGVLFTALAIALGSLWGKPVWGTWWTWDPRLTTTAVLLLIYVGYLAVRRITDSPVRRARWCAVIGIVGFVDVPIVHLSVVWWRSLHQGPTIARLGGPEIHGTMLAALLVGVAAFTLVYAYLMTLRLRVGRLEERAAREALSPRIGAPTPQEVEA
jgi:heme exporter protein C